MQNLIKEYFKQLFTADQPQMDTVLNCIPSSISAQQNTELLKPIVDEEVKEAVFHMHPDKASGPDGMNPAFFSKELVSDWRRYSANGS